MGDHHWEVSRMLLLSIVYLLLSVWRALKSGNACRAFIAIEELDYLQTISILLADNLKNLSLHGTAAFDLFYWEFSILKEFSY
jgi:hypothetical protein